MGGRAWPSPGCSVPRDSPKLCPPHQHPGSCQEPQHELRQQCAPWTRCSSTLRCPTWQRDKALSLAINCPEIISVPKPIPDSPEMLLLLLSTGGLGMDEELTSPSFLAVFSAFCPMTGMSSFSLCRTGKFQRKSREPNQIESDLNQLFSECSRSSSMSETPSILWPYEPPAKSSLLDLPWTAKHGWFI